MDECDLWLLYECGVSYNSKSNLAMPEPRNQLRARALKGARIFKADENRTDVSRLARFLIQFFTGP